MVKKLLVFLMVALMLAAIITGCGVKSSQDSVSGVYGSEPGTIDPALNQTLDGGIYINHAFEGLTTVSTGKVEPAIAKSWDVSADGMVYTFHLRDAVWTDGVAVKAQDFEYAWKRVLNPETASPYAYILYYIKGAEAYNSGAGSVDDVMVKAKDDKTLEVILVAPTAFFTQLTAFMTYMPVRQDVIEANPENWTQNPETYVSNGAFKMKEWKHSEELIFENNDKYWDKNNVYLKEIRFKLMDDDAAALSATEAGEIDINFRHIPTTEIPRLKQEGKLKIYPDLAVYFYDFNITKEPFTDIKVRQAFNLAIDRTEIVEKVTLAGQVPANAWVPYGAPDADPMKTFRDVSGKDYFPATANVAEAQKLLADAGFPNGEGFPEIELIYNTSEGHKKIAEKVQEQLKKNLNINIKITNMEWAVFVEERNNGNYTFARDGWGADYNDPMTFLDMWTSSSGNNNTGWKSDAYDKLIKDAQNTGDLKKRFEYLHQAEDIFLTDMPVMPFYYYTQAIMENAKLKGQYVSPIGQYFLHHAYFE
ncbi:MAG: peptide ABC transporter substrate-binding protein [Clostridiales bacterium]|nr:peptide ABC transporter substrate-binding protein [Clostridiales bacterium]